MVGPCTCTQDCHPGVVGEGVEEQAEGEGEEGSKEQAQKRLIKKQLQQRLQQRLQGYHDHNGHRAWIPLGRQGWEGQQGGI